MKLETIVGEHGAEVGGDTSEEEQESGQRSARAFLQRRSDKIRSRSYQMDFDLIPRRKTDARYII